MFAKRSWPAARRRGVACRGLRRPARARATAAARSTNILAGTQRSEANRARDVYRHPKETLLFFGIRPDMTVLEVWPEPGWYTEILAPLRARQGQVLRAP